MSHLEPELLSAYVDDAVTMDERVHIDAHLPGCAHCQGQLDALGFVRASARTLERPTIPELHRKQLWREINRTRRAPATKWRALVAVAGTAAAIAAFSGLTMLGSSSGPNVRAVGIEVLDAGKVSNAQLDELLAVTAMDSAAGAYGPTSGDSLEAPPAAAEVSPLVAGAPSMARDGMDLKAVEGDEDVNHGAQIARCEEIIKPGGDGGAIAVNYLVARYQGTDVYVLVYDIPRSDPTHREVYVVSRTECRELTHRSSV